MILTIERVTELKRHAEMNARREHTPPDRYATPYEIHLLCDAWLELETRVKCKDAEKLNALEKRARELGDERR